MENVDYNWALIAAGIIGCMVAVVHGVLLQKLMIRPILSGAKLAETSKRLVPLLLHFSTIFWFLGGVALIAVPLVADRSAVLTSTVFVGAMYSFGAVGNFWGTSGKHPGWMLLAVAVALIVYGAPV